MGETGECREEIGCVGDVEGGIVLDNLEPLVGGCDVVGRIVEEGKVIVDDGGFVGDFGGWTCNVDSDVIFGLRAANLEAGADLVA